MRLIDADELQKKFNEVRSEQMSDARLRRDIAHLVASAIMVTQMIQDAPTIDLHGEWIKAGSDEQDEGMFFCSHCRDERWFGDEVYTSSEAERLCHYCPNCGARMDGGNKNVADMTGNQGKNVTKE